MTMHGPYRPIKQVLLDEPSYLSLSPAAKLTFLTLKVKLGPSGIDVINAPIAVLAAQTGLSADAVKNALQELRSVNLVRREANVVEIVGGLEDGSTYSHLNENHRKAVQKHLRSLPQLPIVADFRTAHPEWFSPSKSDSVTQLADSIAIPSEGHPQGDRNAIEIRTKDVGQRQEEKKTQPATSGLGKDSHSITPSSGRQAVAKSANGSSEFARRRGEGMIKAAELRSMRQTIQTPSGPRHSIPKAALADLSPVIKHALQVVGGAHVLASVEEERLPIVVGQFATAYAAAFSMEC
jgi:hypothetical protein